MKPQTIKVILRQFSDGDIIALFPEIPTDLYGNYCQSYMQVGQHGGASPNLISSTTAVSLENELAVNLWNELKQVYSDCELQLVKRISPEMTRARKAEAFSLRRS